MQVITPPKVYPVIIVGSGASGRMAAWNLTRQGSNVFLLDAGEKPETFFLDTRQELGDDGRVVLGAFEACTHPEHQGGC